MSSVICIVKGKGMRTVTSIFMRSRPRLKRLALGLAAILLFNPVAAQAQQARPALTVGVASVEPRPLKRIVVGTGSVVAWEELIIAAEATGLRVLEVPVEEGQAVRKGQLLVRLDDTVLQAEMRQMEAAIKEAEASLAEARSNLGRAQRLAPGAAITEQALEQRQTLARTGEARLNIARAQMEERRAKIEQTLITAPADGIVSKRAILMGAVVSPGTELVRIIRDARLEVDAEVPELDIDLVRPNQTVRIIHGETIVEARVRAVAPTVDPKTRLGIVEVALPKGTPLRPGMYARAEIQIADVVALAVPQESLVFRDGRPAVFEVDAQNRANLRPLETGMRQSGWVEVRAGVERGRRVVVAGAGFLNDGDLVAIGTAQAGEPAR